MKTLLTYIVLGLISAVAHSQISSPESNQPVHYHTVYTTNGSVLKGEITEWNVDFITLRLLSDVEITIDAGKIRKIISRETPVRTVIVHAEREKKYQFREEGMYHVAGFAFSAGPAPGIGMSHVVGYRFSRLLGAGIGTGVESFDVGSGNAVVPVFAEVRGFFLPMRMSPYFMVKAGYGIALKNDETNITKATGGKMLGIGLGYRFGASETFNFFAGAGFHFQDVSYDWQWSWGERVTDNIHYRRTELKLGVMF